MDRSTKAKAAAKAAQEILENPKAKDVLKLQAAKLIFEYESEQARLAEQRAQRRHEQRQDQKQDKPDNAAQQQVQQLTAEAGKLRAEVEGLKEELTAANSVADSERSTAKSLRSQLEYAEAKATKTVSRLRDLLQEFLSVEARERVGRKHFAKGNREHDGVYAALGIAPETVTDWKVEEQLAAPKHPSLVQAMERWDGKRQPFSPSPAPRNAAGIAERERQQDAARETAQQVQPITPPDPLDRYISELPPIMDGDDVPMPSDNEYLLALREGNKLLDRALEQPRFRPLVSDAIPDSEV